MSVHEPITSLEELCIQENSPQAIKEPGIYC